MREIKLRPKTINDAVKVLIPMFKGMENYMETNEDSFAAFCHSQVSGGIGMKIRNILGFWENENTTLYKELNENGCKHPDNMSDYLIRLVHKHYINNGLVKV